jgi:hypothetical protein
MTLTPCKAGPFAHPALSAEIPHAFGIYLTCPHAHAIGHRYGAWLDCSKLLNTAAYTAAIKEFTDSSPWNTDGAWTISDWDMPTVAVEDKCLATLAEYVRNWRQCLDYQEQQAYDEYITDRCQVVSYREFKEALIGYYKDETDFCWNQCTEPGIHEFGEFIDWERYWESRYERDGYTAFSVPNGMAFFRPV